MAPKFAIVNSSELGGNWSATFHIHRQAGQAPYLPVTDEQGNVSLRPAKSHEYNRRHVLWLTPEGKETYLAAAAKLAQARAEFDRVVSGLEADDE